MVSLHFIGQSFPDTRTHTRVAARECKHHNGSKDCFGPGASGRAVKGGRAHSGWSSALKRRL